MFLFNFFRSLFFFLIIFSLTASGIENTEKLVIVRDSRTLSRQAGVKLVVSSNDKLSRGFQHDRQCVHPAAWWILLVHRLFEGVLTIHLLFDYN